MHTRDEFRLTLGHFATGVTIVAAFDRLARPTGLTANAFASVSLVPPLVLVCVHHQAHACRALQDGGRFGVNILRADQEGLARRFAARHPDRFEGVPYRHGDKLDVPLIDGALAQIECATAHVHVEGDHVVFVGHVERVHVGTGAPLVYFRGAYPRLEDPARCVGSQGARRGARA